MESHPLYSELRRVLDGQGKTDIPVTKTSLWQYSLYKKSGFQDNGIIYLRGNPPVSKTGSSKRILVCSTRSESDVLNRIFDKKLCNNDLELKEEAKNYLNMFHKNHLPGEDMNVEKLAEIRNAIKIGDEIHYCFSTDTFWQNFFNSPRFLDESVTIPEGMISTGYLRNYIDGAGGTIECSKRLKQIAGKWKVPIDFVGTCAP
jgi:hypothetical protein